MRDGYRRPPAPGDGDYIYIHNYIFIIIYVYTYLVGGFNHFLFTISYMGCHPSH